MKPWQIKIGSGLLAVLLLSVYFSANNQEKISTVSGEVSHSLLVEGEVSGISAEAYGVFDAETGEVIYGHGTKEVLPIASVTKLITAGAVLKDLDGEAEVTVTESDLTTYGRSGRLGAGEVYTNHELLFPLLLESSNDASATFERTSDGEIIQAMNEVAKEAGGQETELVDASGLSGRNVSTVEDLALITTKLLKTEPHLFDITRLSKRAGPYVGWANNNPVIGEDYLGGKHGFTEEAGRTLVALYTEKFGGEEKVVGYILLGSEDLVSDTNKLREFVKGGAHLK